MHTLPGGFFLFKFQEEADRIKVLEEGPWSFFGRPIVVKEWRSDLELKKDLFNSLPIWIRLPNLDLRLWDSESIEKIASVAGHPRFVDDATVDRERLSFARICVEITPLCDFPETVNILIGTKWIKQDIHYEWRPFACTYYNTFEHRESNCSVAGGIPEKVSDDQVKKPVDAEVWKEAGHRKELEKARSQKDTRVPTKILEKSGRENSKYQKDRGSTSNAFTPLLTEEETHADEENLIGISRKDGIQAIPENTMEKDTISVEEDSSEEIPSQVDKISGTVSDSEEGEINVPEEDQEKDVNSRSVEHTRPEFSSSKMISRSSSCLQPNKNEEEGSSSKFTDVVDREMENDGIFRISKSHEIAKRMISDKEVGDLQEDGLIIQLGNIEAQVNGDGEGLPGSIHEGSSEGKANFLSHRGVRR